MQNDLRTIRSMKITRENVNVTDQFGWTALMMAACENHICAVDLICQLGADISICDRQNRSAIELARSKGHTQILSFLENYFEYRRQSNGSQRTEEKQTASGSTTFRCEVCQCNVRDDERQQHTRSTLHRFNSTDSHKFARHFGIPESNTGFKMMLRQGWNRESGLGATQSGHLYPVKTVRRKFRSGLGIEQAHRPRVTHFQPHDRSAIEDTKPRQPRKIDTRRQLRMQKARDRRSEINLRNILSWIHVMIKHWYIALWICFHFRLQFLVDSAANKMNGARIAEKPLKILIDTERVADQVLQSKQEIIELDKRRQSTREALRLVEKSNEKNAWVTVGPILIKMERKKAIEMLTNGRYNWQWKFSSKKNW